MTGFRLDWLEFNETCQERVVAGGRHCNGMGNEEAEIVVSPFPNTLVEVIQQVHQVKG